MGAGLRQRRAWSWLPQLRTLQGTCRGRPLYDRMLSVCEPCRPLQLQLYMLDWGTC